MSKTIATDVAAVIFDLDGVLADSTPMVERAWRTWSAECGVDAETVLKLTHGRRKPEILEMAVPHLPREQAIARLIALETEQVDAVIPVPGASEITKLLPAGKWAIATSGERGGALLRLQRVGITPPSVLISAEDVMKGKPQPEVYLRAAAGLGVMPQKCVVFEDAPAGIEAALAAGMTPVGLETTYPASALDRAVATVKDFRQVVITLADGNISAVSVV